jgi:hypothetical protein
MGENNSSYLKSEKDFEEMRFGFEKTPTFSLISNRPSAFYSYHTNRQEIGNV